MKKIFVLLLTGSFILAHAQIPAAKNEVLDRIKAAEKYTVLLNNKQGLIPLADISTLHIASVHFKYDKAPEFDSIANKYQAVAGFTADEVSTKATLDSLHDRLKWYNLLIIQLSSKTHFAEPLLSFLQEQSASNKVIVVLTGNGKNLASLDKIAAPVIWNKSATKESAAMAAQLIFGGMAARGKLDASYSKNFIKGSGFVTRKTRLGYSVPEDVAINSRFLENGMDSLANAGIANHAAPAVVVLLAKDGKVIFHKAYGKHTYDGKEPILPDDIFDLASVTKVSATTQAVMRLYDEKKLNLDSPISRYVSRTRTIADKATIKVKEALLHEAGYTPYIKFFQLLKPSDMSRDSSAAFPTGVGDHYFLRANYFEEVMWPVTLASKVETRGKFVYSDVSMYMMKEVIETITHQKLNEWLLQQLYFPLGMQSTGYLPRSRFDIHRIVPTTENDNWFRNMLVRGYVNDPGAAMAGGVEGHAGLFANANDLAILYQMLLNKGSYGGHAYYKPSTVALFTGKRSAASGRGYGFARVNEAMKMSDSSFISQQAFGHSGYTGTYVWVDPKYNLVYICLTNRVYPDDNKTFPAPKTNLRLALLDMFYQAIKQGNSLDNSKIDN